MVPRSIVVHGQAQQTLRSGLCCWCERCFPTLWFSVHLAQVRTDDQWVYQLMIMSQWLRAWDLSFYYGPIVGERGTLPKYCKKICTLEFNFSRVFTSRFAAQKKNWSRWLNWFFCQWFIDKSQSGPEKELESLTQCIFLSMIHWQKSIGPEKELEYWLNVYFCQWFIDKSLSVHMKPFTTSQKSITIRTESMTIRAESMSLSQWVWVNNWVNHLANQMSQSHEAIN